MLHLARPKWATNLWSLCLGLVGTAALYTTAPAQTPHPWTSAGGDISNSHAMTTPTGDVGTPRQIGPRTARSLAVKWSFVTNGDISATPTVEAGGLYVPDWSGWLYKIDPAAGTLIWSHPVCDYTSTCGTVTSSISRTAPAIGQNVIVIGDAEAHYDRANYGAVVIGVNKATGAKAWTTIVNNTSPYASVIGSPVIYNNIVYVGTASWEEGIAETNLSYHPIFRGNVTALNADTGAIIWQFTTVPAGYAGGAIPGSNMVVWPKDNALLFGTGNNYFVPAPALNCVGNAGKNAQEQTACLDPTDYVDSLMSVDLATGRLKWGRRMSGADDYTLACYVGLSSCPKPTGGDVDFAQAPLLTWVPNFNGVSDDRAGTSQSYLLGAGQKNSVYYAVNPLNGGLFWSTWIGTGGMEWGSTVNADDLNMIYVALNNPKHVTQNIIGTGGTNPQRWSAGAWGALNITTGKVKWMIPTIGNDLVNPTQGASAPGCMTFADRVVFAGSSSGVMVGMDANTGYVYWTFSSGGTVVSCPAIYNETVYWGTGYARNGVGKHILYAFAVP